MPTSMIKVFCDGLVFAKWLLHFHFPEKKNPLPPSEGVIEMRTWCCVCFCLVLLRWTLSKISFLVFWLSRFHFPSPAVVFFILSFCLFRVCVCVRVCLSLYIYIYIYTSPLRFPPLVRFLYCPYTPNLFPFHSTSFFWEQLDGSLHAVPRWTKGRAWSSLCKTG